MPYYCTVPRCTSMAGKAKNVSFHQFPRDEELAKLWNKILKRGKPYTKYSKVCSLHFTAEDYTITSVGKNKGQWRTLRKDAIPSQNLPSESPTPYQRKQWSAWSHGPAPNIIDPSIQQQVAQAIYMQTMLAMQAAGSTDLPSLNPGNGLPLPLPTESYAHTSTVPDTDILKGKQTNTEQNTSYKCTECSKCFKDPDVFILHKRTHIKNEKKEKENFNLNLTLQANPILANLLKTNPENSNIFDNNLMSMENFLMTALAANMEGYMRNFTSMIKGQHREGNGHDRGQYDHDQRQSDHDEGESDHDREMNEHGMSESDQDSDMNHDQNNVGPERTDFTDRDSYVQSSLDLRLPLNKDCQSTTLKSILDHSGGVPNHSRNSIMHSKGHIIFDRNLMNQNRDTNPIPCDSNVFQNSIYEHIRSNAQPNRYYENKDLVNGSSRNSDVMVNYDQSVINRGKFTINHDRNMNDHGKPMVEHGGVTNGDDVDSHGLNTEHNCDSDLNESIDSNKLVIDEVV